MLTPYVIGLALVNCVAAACLTPVFGALHLMARQQTESGQAQIQ